MTDQTERERAICDRIARRMGGRFVEREDNPMTDTPEAVAAAFGASDMACYLYPGEEQQPERAAYCKGASDHARPDADIVRQLVEAGKQYEEMAILHGQQVSVTFKDAKDGAAFFTALRDLITARAAGYGGQS
ncbi:hypothetical protein IP68_12545 [Blastomonas sp. AAP25]|uniref:hypothetical protein n=1 Tax=Blastomonas sp. AAP25 TaxID=1523416 RepID=UPI0006B9E247|nr:hypothetical protein [Blastomonas sp. AAP25]KPF74581.1 hypothetical protein IP68_12545 [Blastomonas sp. AAP25]